MVEQNHFVWLASWQFFHLCYTLQGSLPFRSWSLPTIDLEHTSVVGHLQVFLLVVVVLEESRFRAC
jgi:hypothetical protein